MRAVAVSVVVLAVRRWRRSSEGDMRGGDVREAAAVVRRRRRCGDAGGEDGGKIMYEFVVCWR